MKIHYEGSIYTFQKYGGISRYFSNLITGLPRSYHPILSTPGIKLESFPNHKNLHVISPNVSWIPSYRLGKKFNNTLRELLVKYKKFDIYHPTYYFDLNKKYLRKRKVPFVLNVWDMIHEKFPDEMDPGGRSSNQKKHAVKNADIIICISENTKKDLMNIFGTHESKIKVIYLASEISVSTCVEPYPSLSQPYFLFVGKRNKYKNFSTLLEAFKIFHSKYSDVFLAIVGKPFTRDEINTINEKKIYSNVINLGQLNDTQLSCAYKHSIALVYPSKYEGFGIPVLEAMACHTPVIAGNSSSLPEVIGNGGLLFNSDDFEELESLMEQIYSSDSVRENLISKGIDQVKKFSWEKTIKETVQVYESLK